MTRVARLLGMLALALALSGCAYGPPPTAGKTAARPPPASPPLQHGSMAVWRLDELLRAQGGPGEGGLLLLRTEHGIFGVMEAAMIRRISGAGAKIVAAAGKEPAPDWLLVGSEAINAFAFYPGGKPSIAITLGMVRLLGEDENAWGALLGHELAHLRLEHHQRMRERHESSELTSSVAGILMSLMGLPIGSVVADATTGIVNRAYSRDEEHEADKTGLDYMIRAGLDPRGALTLQQRMRDATPGSGETSFLSTHPGSDERIETLKKIIEQGK